MIHLEYSNGATPIDPDEVAGLKLTHITTRGELDRWEQDNIYEALIWLEKQKLRDLLNEGFIRELHKRMFGNVWKWAGKFRRTDKNIGVPWSQISTSFRNLLDDTKLWMELEEVPPDEMAARFHHRLVSIHPFPNGNGRHARLMTDLFLENFLDCPQFTWGGKNLSKISDARQRYIIALHAADEFDYQPLIEFARS